MHYFDDEGLRLLQVRLLKDPRAGAVIAGTGGLRKLRCPDSRRLKGTRSGIRVIYYWWEPGCQFWLFSLYGKNEMTDLASDSRRALRTMLVNELAARCDG